jgi:hypothetical protein
MSIAMGLRALSAAWACCLLLLSGCGPGVGGTGTGETGTALEAFGALPASVCSGELAPLMACASPAAGAAPAPGAAAVLLADTVDGRQVQLTLSGDTVELGAPCARVQFRGAWGAVAGQPGKYFGHADLGGTLAAAALQAQPSGGDVTLTLRDATGRVLLGPVLVRVVVAFAAPGSCG